MGSLPGVTADFTTPLTVEQMYGEWGIEWEDVVAIPDESLDPRPRTSIYDTFAALGVRGPSCPRHRGTRLKK
jgi:hypothetical protein